MIKRDPEEFAEMSIMYGITKWEINQCSMCGYQCGYVFSADGDVYYDNGCYCLRNPIQKSSWEDVSEHYNRQENVAVIDAMDEYWHFDAVSRYPEEHILPSGKKARTLGPGVWEEWKDGAWIPMTRRKICF